VGTPQRLYSPAAINVDFALITLKTPVTEGTGYFGIQRGTGEANIDISSVRPAPCSHAAQQLCTVA
jgi:hypothetical protein